MRIMKRTIRSSRQSFPQQNDAKESCPADHTATAQFCFEVQGRCIYDILVDMLPDLKHLDLISLQQF